MKKLLLLSLLTCYTLDAFSQLRAIQDGPSLASTLEWASTNVVNVYINDTLNYRQRFTYDLENECQCRFIVTSMYSDGFLNKEYTFNFGNIDPNTIQMEQTDGLVAIKLGSYEKGSAIQVVQGNIVESGSELTIYDKSAENATRLIRAFVHIANLCKP